MNPITHPNRLFLLCTIVLALPLLAGCFNRNAPAGPQIQDTLPEGWEPVTFGGGGLFSSESTWLPVNVDDDSPEEYLLYFMYDNQQIGAVIYKELLDSAGSSVLSATPIPAPNQPSSTFIPYRLAPSYWLGSGSAGYVAEPDTPSDQIITKSVARAPVSALDSSAALTPTQDSPSIKELVIFGGETLLTVAWWQNSYNGYGVTQVRARAGLVNEQYQDGDESKPVVSITGLDPLPDPLGRSVMCRQARHVRSPAPEQPTTLPNPYASAIQYLPTDEGIVFCLTPLPSYPFYPEGVALAFLRPEDRDTPQTLAELNAYRAQLVQDESGVEDAREAEKAKEQKVQAWLSLFDFDGPDNDTMPTVIVDQLVSPSTLELTEDFRSPSGQPLTTVACARVLSPDRMSTRVLLLNLLYQAPTLVITPGNGNQPATTTTTTDRMIITNVTDQTATNLSCQQLVNDAMAATGQTGTQP